MKIRQGRVHPVAQYLPRDGVACLARRLPCLEPWHHITARGLRDGELTYCPVGYVLTHSHLHTGACYPEDRYPTPSSATKMILGIPMKLPPEYTLPDGEIERFFEIESAIGAFMVRWDSVNMSLGELPELFGYEHSDNDPQNRCGRYCRCGREPVQPETDCR